MKFHPRLSNIESKLTCRLNKLLDSEWSESKTINSNTIKIVDISDSNLKINDVLLNYVTSEYVTDFEGNKYTWYELLEENLKELNEYLETFIFQNEC